MPTDDDLERWIASFRGPLVGLLASWGHDWHAAEELAADVFAEAWIGRARLAAEPSDHAAVGSWLHGIAFHLSQARRRRMALRHAEPLERAADLAAPVAEEDERRAVLVEAFTRLSSAYQTVLRMHYLEQSSVREVAALLRLAPKAVEDRLYQARRTLREHVERIAARGTTGARS